MDDEGIIRLCNQAAERLLARPGRQLIDKPFGYPVVDGRSTEVELMLPRGRTRVVEMRTTTTTLQGKRMHIISLRDVTLRRQAERDLAEALERQNVVLAVAAHEFRSPLSAIGMLAQVLADKQRKMTAAERADIIDRIVRLTIRLQLLVRKLLTAARIQSGEVRTNPENVPVLDVIVEQLAEISANSENVRVTCGPDLTAVTDRAAFSIMLANYLDNAVAYGSPPIEIQAIRKKEWAEIRVIDHGAGVPASFAPQLFERFGRGPRAERKSEGAGLGLWIVRAFATANGGDAWHEPVEGGGACFCLRLPAAHVRLSAEPGRVTVLSGAAMPLDVLWVSRQREKPGARRGSR